MASHAVRLDSLLENLGSPAYQRNIGSKSKVIWAYGAKKKVKTDDCGKVDVKYFVEAHLISITEDRGHIISCKVLERTIVSASKDVSPIQDRDVLPFTVEEHACKGWLEISRSKLRKAG
ncbi:hypothetical protein GCM10025793_10650 [Lysobacter lycopersici]